MLDAPSEQILHYSRRLTCQYLIKVWPLTETQCSLAGEAQHDESPRQLFPTIIFPILAKSAIMASVGFRAVDLDFFLKRGLVMPHHKNSSLSVRVPPFNHL